MSESDDPRLGDVDHAIRQLWRAAGAEKCRACGCLHNSLEAIERAIAAGTCPEEIREAISSARAELVDVQYDCLGCDPCYPAAAMNALNIEGEACRAEPVEHRAGWPPLAGDYTVVRYHAPVAVCTLTDGGLSGAIAKAAGPDIAIVGTMQTENLGIERVIQDLLANPNIRFLILCGSDSRQAVGHLPGQSFLALAQSGVDEQGRIIGAEGTRPLLRNITPQVVEHFRRTVEMIDMIGITDAASILAAARTSAARNPGPAEPYCHERIVPTIRGSIPPKMTPDPAGYFVVYADRQRNDLSVEHYTTAGVLDTVIEGRTAAEVYLSAIDMALVSRLDHAAYLGKELTRAERSLASGERYVQDAAPQRDLPETCGCGGDSCGPERKGTHMRKWILLAFTLGLAVVAAVIWASHTRPTVSTGEPIIEAPAVLAVDAYMRNVDRYRGSVTVEGVVSAAVPDETTLALIDLQEWLECGSVTCPMLTLPVRWAGAMPDVEAIVRVEGQARQIDGKLVFVATSISRSKLDTEVAPCDDSPE